MMRRLFQCAMAGGLFFLTACSDRQPPAQTDDWSDIQPLADEAVPVQSADSTPARQSTARPLDDIVEAEGLLPYVERLREMKRLQRGKGETLLTGEKLVFDQDRRFVQLEKSVEIVDDEGRLSADRLTARFSASNRVDIIEADGTVRIQSGTRTARADTVVYDYADRHVQLQGHAEASDGKNRISGERIELWVGQGRRLVCEPNALLELAEGQALALDGAPNADGGEPTEIRAGRVEYAEADREIRLDGNVRLRDPRGAMNCNRVRIFLKETDEIDWIEAVGEVIIQADERKALADRAAYHASEGKFTLEGEPKIKQGPHIMTGDRILFWPETRRMVCEPNARALLYPDEETRARFEKDLNN